MKSMKKLSKATGIFPILAASLILYSLVPYPVHSAATNITTFGNGKVQVRLYSDYFCSACRRVEPKIEGILAKLVNEDRITLTFVDTPIHRYSPLYAKYFLYALNAKRDFKHVLAVRRTLFKAANEKIETGEKLEVYLREHRIPFKEFNVRPVFEVMSTSLRADQINATPTLVIESDGRKSIYKGEDEIVPALEAIQPESARPAHT